MRHTHVPGMAIVELEHRHRFLIGQRRVRPAEAFESLFVETAQTIIERFVFGMRALYELFRCQIFGKFTPRQLSAERTIRLLLSRKQNHLCRT